jgi:hypothetical protein
MASERKTWSKKGVGYQMKIEENNKPLIEPRMNHLFL